jgi:hypothetical protein
MFLIDFPEYMIKIRKETKKEREEIYKKIRQIIIEEGFLQERIHKNYLNYKSFKKDNISIQIKYENQIDKKGLNIIFFQKKNEMFRFLSEQKISFIEYKKVEKIMYKIIKTFKKEKKYILYKNKTKVDEINYFKIKNSFDLSYEDYGKFNILKQKKVKEYVEKSSYGRDRDGKELKNQEVKYFRCQQTGRLKRGIISHNINNMWWVVVNKGEIQNIANFELFDIENHKNQLKYKRLKADYKERWNKKQRQLYFQKIKE